MPNLLSSVNRMRAGITAFMEKESLDPETTAGVYDFVSQCAIYYDVKSPSDTSKHKAYRAILASTTDYSNGSLIWTWGNKNLPDTFCQDAEPLRQYGQEKSIPEFDCRALLVHPVTAKDKVLFTTIRATRDFSKGFEADIAMDEQGSLYSRLTGEELFAVCTYIFKAKMSSSLPIPGAPFNADIFIVDDTQVKNPRLSGPTLDFLGL